MLISERYRPQLPEVAYYTGHALVIRSQEGKIFRLTIANVAQRL